MSSRSIQHHRRSIPSRTGHAVEFALTAPPPSVLFVFPCSSLGPSRRRLKLIETNSETPTIVNGSLSRSYRTPERPRRVAQQYSMRQLAHRHGHFDRLAVLNIVDLFDRLVLVFGHRDGFLSSPRCRKVVGDLFGRLSNAVDIFHPLLIVSGNIIPKKAAVRTLSCTLIPKRLFRSTFTIADSLVMSRVGSSVVYEFGGRFERSVSCSPSC